MKTAMDIPDKEGRKRLVIVGGGFGGLKLARKLKSDKYQIVLLDKNNHHIFQPMPMEGHNDTTLRLVQCRYLTIHRSNHDNTECLFH